MGNKMGEVAKLLGVELGERFKIEKSTNSYIKKLTERNIIFRLTKRGIVDKHETIYPQILVHLLNDEGIIEKLPFKPRLDDRYHYVYGSGVINADFWKGSLYDYYRYNANNCFKTRGEITEADIERIIREIKGKYNEEL